MYHPVLCLKRAKRARRTDRETTENGYVLVTPGRHGGPTLLLADWPFFYVSPTFPQGNLDCWCAVQCEVVVTMTGMTIAAVSIATKRGGRSTAGLRQA